MNLFTYLPYKKDSRRILRNISVKNPNSYYQLVCKRKGLLLELNFEDLSQMYWYWKDAAASDKKQNEKHISYVFRCCKLGVDYSVEKIKGRPVMRDKKVVFVPYSKKHTDKKESRA